MPNGLNSTLDTEKEKMASQQLRNKRKKEKKNPRVSGNATRAYMEMKEPEIAKTILKRKSEVGKFTLPDVKIYDKAIIRPYKDRQVY